MSTMKNAIKLWGGVFNKKTDKLVECFTTTNDGFLAEYDCMGSIAHVEMLKKCKIISGKDVSRIISGLKNILKQIRLKKFKFDNRAEDIHTNIENELKRRVGDVADKLHTARSRNDQVALDLRLYLKDEISRIVSSLSELQKVILNMASKNLDVVMPGFTHMQHAQPVLFSHYIMAYFFKLQRDKERLLECLDRISVLPLGSCAVAGTSLNIDRKYVAKLLNFKKISENSIDAVSDRDFAIEFLSNSSILMMHLSGIAEEIVLWSTREFNFIEIDESFCTGSSIMPQKKNPDVAELIRGKTGSIFGNLISLLTTMKGLPLSYNRDMQEDKTPVYNTSNIIEITLVVMTAMLENTRINKSMMLKSLDNDFSVATDIAEYLVRKGMGFRTAHKLTGEIVNYCLKNSKSFNRLKLNEYKKFSSLFDNDIYKYIKIENSVNSKNSLGGTSLKRVKEEIAYAKKILLKN